MHEDALCLLGERVVPRPHGQPPKSTTGLVERRGRGFLLSGALFQGVLIRGVPAVLFIEVSSFQGVLTLGIKSRPRMTVAVSSSAKPKTAVEVFK